MLVLKLTEVSSPFVEKENVVVDENSFELVKLSLDDNKVVYLNDTWEEFSSKLKKELMKLNTYLDEVSDYFEDEE